MIMKDEVSGVRRWGVKISFNLDRLGSRGHNIEVLENDDLRQYQPIIMQTLSKAHIYAGVSL